MLKTTLSVSGLAAFAPETEEEIRMLNKRNSLAVFIGSLLLISSLPGLALAKTDPYLKSTRTQLMKARAHLFAGEKDKGGHREQAVALTSAAIDEVTAAMKSNHHGSNAHAIKNVATATGAEVGSHMRKALIHLKQAKENLGAAAPVPGGRKEKVMELIDKAIEQVEKANALSA